MVRAEECQPVGLHKDGWSGNQVPSNPEADRETMDGQCQGGH